MLKTSSGDRKRVRKGGKRVREGAKGRKGGGRKGGGRKGRRWM